LGQSTSFHALIASHGADVRLFQSVCALDAAGCFTLGVQTSDPAQARAALDRLARRMPVAPKRAFATLRARSLRTTSSKLGMA
jgi:hypothetical protein